MDMHLSRCETAGLPIWHAKIYSAWAWARGAVLGQEAPGHKHTQNHIQSKARPRFPTVMFACVWIFTFIYIKFSGEVVPAVVVAAAATQPA